MIAFFAVSWISLTDAAKHISLSRLYSTDGYNTVHSLNVESKYPNSLTTKLLSLYHDASASVGNLFSRSYSVMYAQVTAPHHRGTLWLKLFVTFSLSTICDKKTRAPLIHSSLRKLDRKSLNSSLRKLDREASSWVKVHLALKCVDFIWRDTPA